VLVRIPTIFTLAALTLAAQDPKPEGPPVKFRSDVSLVRVNARVVDQNNRPIRYLRADDFVLRVDGKPQDVRNFQSESGPIDVVLLLDVSRSMEPHVQKISSASHQALSALSDQDRIAIMVFDRATRVRMPFRASRTDAERELARVIDDETFRGGTDITRGLLDAASYMEQNARHDARRAIVILTDDQTELNRDEPAVGRALNRADAVLSALIAPDALHTGTQNRDSVLPDDERLRRWFGDVLPPGFTFSGFGPRTRSAGTSRIATQSGGDSMTIDDASAFQDTLARIRERYALYYYLPEGVQPGEVRSVEIDLSDAVRQRYPGAKVMTRDSAQPPSATPRRVRV
jgi:VWFA-related protein